MFVGTISPVIGDRRRANSSRLGVVLAAALMVAASACSESASGDAEQTSTVAATVPTTTIPATTTAPSTSTTSTSTTTTTTLPVLDTSVLADVIAAATLGPVPPDTEIKNARFDISPLEDNGCHVGWGATEPSGLPCEYGDTTSDVVIVIAGDSHVAAWFGAFDEAGKANNWKIVTVTKRGCPIADVSVYSAIDRSVTNAPYPACDTWRQNAIEHINSLSPDLVVLPMLTRRGVVGYRGSDAIRQWGLGLGRTLDALAVSGTKLLVISDTPKSIGESIPLCVSAHQQDISRCGNSRSEAVLEERLAVLAETAPLHHATYVDTSNWFCTETFCPAVINSIVVYSDDSHLTDSFVRYRSPQIAQAIRVALASSP